MKATYAQCDKFGTEPLYQVTLNGKTCSTPLSGKMAHHICDILNDFRMGMKRLKWSCSRNQTREVINMIRHIKKTAS